MTDSCNDAADLPPAVHDHAGPVVAIRYSADAQLLSQVADGDEAAFGLLYLRHAHACRAQARGVLGCPDWVEDVVQMVFLDVWRLAARYDDSRSRGSARRWLVVLAHNKAVDVVREQQRHRRWRAEESLLADHADPGRGPDDLAAATDCGDRLRSAFADVAPLARQTVSMRFLQQMSEREVAAALQVPLGTVKTRTHRGVHALRRLVDPSLL
jgi:RNA polymerase sigma-70 factor (ECF subfamily)